MKRLSEEIAAFFRRQGFVIVTTIDADGSPHNSCKGVLRLSRDGRLYLMDVYMQRTYANLLRNSRISVTAVDEHLFQGYCLKGTARIVPLDRLNRQLHKAWEQRLNSRITSRIIRNMRQEQGHPAHPESRLPAPQYLIVMEVRRIVDLAPSHIRQEE